MKQVYEAFKSMCGFCMMMTKTRKGNVCVECGKIK